MAKAKHQKSKPSRQPKQTHSKKRGGRQNDVSELRAQLDIFGLKIIQVTADGNCFFRALADQLEGDEDAHQRYRNMVVGFIKGVLSVTVTRISFRVAESYLPNQGEEENREMFEPFVEDEVPFDEYCQSMGEDGSWAGHMELQAASLVTHSNICIHRHMSPRWYIQNFDKNEAMMIHLSYHDGEHYNSVRSKDDTCSGPARPIVIKGDADLSAKSDHLKPAAKKHRDERGRNVFHEDSIKLVKAGSGCDDVRKLEEALLQVGGDVDAAIEVLVGEQGCSDHIVAEDECSPSAKTSNDESHDENSDQHKLIVEDQTCQQDLSGSDAGKNYRQNLQPDEKMVQKISRNKACPCGSKKKYKSCCGTVAGRSSARFPVYQTVDYGKSRKDRKQARKGGVTVHSSAHADGGPPDMGALCI